jgi:Lysyl oxidase
MHPVRAALLTLIAAACLSAGALAVAQEPPAGSPPDRTPADDNPCLTAQAERLLCPDLVMRRPYGMYTERLTKPGHTVLRAGNVIDSVGEGPAELHGVRTSPRFMRARQRIYTTNGGRIGIRTGGRLQFKFAHQQLFWWKFYDAARFELWRVDADGRRTRLVRTGPKVAYCLRDLGRTRPWLDASPRRRVYPACSTNSRAQRVTLGTSVGWADIYPPAYPEQWIDVTGLRGCFAYVHIADPENGIYESDEDNNEAQVIVSLPFRSGDARGDCNGRDRGRRYRERPIPY